MALPGTELANKVLDKLALRKDGGRFYRHYTQLRKRDRSHKIYGNFSKPEADAIIRELASAGVRGRVVKSYYNPNRVSGVRFELPKED